MIVSGRRWIRRVGVLAFGFAAGSCSDGVSQVADVAGVMAVVAGVVRDADGNAVPGASVASLVYRSATCPGPEEPGSFPSVATDSLGAFFSHLIIPLTAPFKGCLVLVVTASPPGGSALLPDTVTGVTVRFIEGTPPDTVRVDFVLLSPGP